MVNDKRKEKMVNDKRKKKKRMQPSPSRQETTPEKCSGSSNMVIGCMSGIFQLLSRHQSRRRIPSAARNEKIEIPPATSALALPKQGFTEMNTAMAPKNDGAKFSIGDGGLANRSPTLPSEIRKSGGCFDLENSPRRSPALVARLMGLDEPTPMRPLEPASLSLDSAEETRRKLLGALEQCEEDLRALKCIIDTVRTAEMHRLKAIGEPEALDLQCLGLDNNGEQPSPVSVLEALSSPKFDSSENDLSVLVARSLLPVFSEAAQKKIYSSVEAIQPFQRWTTTAGISRSTAQHKEVKDRAVPAGGGRRKWRWWKSDAVMDNVGKAPDGAMFDEEKRVAVGVVSEVADDLAGDLVDGLVMELLGCSHKLAAQTGRCKRKLYA